MSRPRTPLEKFPEPELGAKEIPAERYTSPDFMQREWDHMWTRTWLCAGPASDVREVGQYFTFEIGRESIIVVRSSRDTVHALYNACQHRGAQVVTEPGCGRVGAFVCPYHLWAYGLDGRLNKVVDREDFPQGIPEAMGLGRLRCELWGGWVFVNMDPEAPTLAEYLGVVADHLAPYDFGNNYYLESDITFEWACNWKTGVDAFAEIYHAQGIHPELLDFTDDVDCPVDIFEQHSRFLFHVLRQSPRWTDERARANGYRDAREWTTQVKEIMQSLGIDPESFEGDMADLRVLAGERLRALGTSAGWDLEDLSDSQLWMDVHYMIFPNITLNISAQHFWWFRARPHPTDPNRMYWDFQNYARKPRDAEAPARPPHRQAVWGDGVEQELHLALRQDGNIVVPVQRGMQSRGFKGLWLAHQERRIRNHHRILDDYLEGRR